jgi:hypothetical protein
MAPEATMSIKTKTLKSKFAIGSNNGTNVMPKMLKKATTHGVQPNVKNPIATPKKGMFVAATSFLNN